MNDILVCQGGSWANQMDANHPFCDSFLLFHVHFFYFLGVMSSLPCSIKFVRIELLAVTPKQPMRRVRSCQTSLKGANGPAYRSQALYTAADQLPCCDQLHWAEHPQPIETQFLYFAPVTENQLHIPRDQVAGSTTFQVPGSTKPHVPRSPRFHQAQDSTRQRVPPGAGAGSTKIGSHVDAAKDGYGQAPKGTTALERRGWETLDWRGKTGHIYKNKKKIY